MVRKCSIRALMLIIGMNVMAVASAEVYPSRPITIVVPAAAGGPGDAFARIIAEHIRSSLGQPATIENIAGASGSIGAGRVARATGDGYTLVLGNWATHVLNGALFTLPYDVTTDFEPIALIARNPLVISARKTMPANTLRELVAWLKANPDKATAGTSGPGSAMHLAGVLFQKETGARFGFVPYRGAAPAIQDLLGGRIDLYIGLAADCVPQVRADNIKAYAVPAKSRLTAAPDIPTVDEAGVPGLYVSGWTGLWAPKGAPKDIIARLNSVILDTLADPAVRQRLAGMGQEIPLRAQQTPDALRAFQKAEIEKWWPIIKTAGIKAE
ncbi:MAG TPA: tripartite tricarboxylate transporter substrate-binding protein [Xanthobacteraceae bacterium]|jgi:tripartite-type tricarboxylate transporter receptor subunit TctC